MTSVARKISRRRPCNRSAGYTLVEILVVLAVIIIIGVVAAPSLLSLFGNTKQKAALDIVKARMADARGRAMSDGIPYRLAISADGTRLRVAPDGPSFADPAIAGDGRTVPLVIETTLDSTTAGLDLPPDGMVSSDSSGWSTVATFLPDGTCKEVSQSIKLEQPGYPPIYVHIRGLSGVTKTTTGTISP